MTKITRGAVTRTAGAYDGMFVGSIVVGVPGVPIAALRGEGILEVIIQNDPDGQNNVGIGDRGGQPFVLRPGENITIPINNPNLVYARSVGGATVNWIAMR